MPAHQAPLSPGSSRQEHWSGLPFPSPMHPEVRREGREPLPDHAGESPLLSPGMGRRILDHCAFKEYKGIYVPPHHCAGLFPTDPS